jgi:hypothetical protein
MSPYGVACCAVLLSALQASSAWAQLAGGGVLPTEAEIQGVKNLCGGGGVQSVSFNGKLDAAIKNWKSGAAGANVEVAKKDLTAALYLVKNDANLEGVMKVYVDCVDRTLQRMLDREKKSPSK